MLTKVLAAALLMAGPARPAASPRWAGVPVLDLEFSAALLSDSRKWAETPGSPRMSDLRRQLGRSSPLALRLKPAGGLRLRPETIAARARDSVVVLGSSYRCGSCADWHLSVATGFAVTTDGIIVTCCHVVDQEDHEGLVAMDARGRSFQVVEVLAADRERDIAVLRLHRGGIPALALGRMPPVGAPVHLLGHTAEQFYTFTSGAVSRYFRGQPETGEHLMMAITADFGRGASGCPVLDEFGGVVGMGDNIVSTSTVDAEGNLRGGPLFKHARPVDALRALLAGSAAGPRPGR